MENVEKTALLGTFDTEFQAEVVRGLLKENNIPSVTSGNSMGFILPQFSKTDGGIRLFVKECDLEKAKQIIKEHNESQNLKENNKTTYNFKSPKTIIGAILFLAATIYAYTDILNGTVIAISFVAGLIGVILLVNGLNEKKQL